jgi:hypothetical protein
MMMTTGQGSVESMPCFTLDHGPEPVRKMVIKVAIELLTASA